MAISDQIGRLTTLRNNIRTKLIGLGILPAASTSATLSECYSVLSNVTGLGASSYTPTTTTQVIPSGRYLSGPQTINAIPSSYIIPTGTSVITANGAFDVKQYASASVNVDTRPYTGTITGNGDDMNTYVTLNGNIYYSAGSLKYSSGETLYIRARNLYDREGIIYVNGSVVSQSHDAAEYRLALPDVNNLSISISSIEDYASIRVTYPTYNLQSKTVTPTQAVQSVTPDAGVYGLSKVTVNAIPSAYIIPIGTVVLSSSGTFDVTSYASADVTVTGGPSGIYKEVVKLPTAAMPTYIASNFSTTIPKYFFENDIVSSMYDINNVTLIESYAFRGATLLYSDIFNNDSRCLEFPEVSRIGVEAFFKASITYEYIKGNRIISFPKVTNLETRATCMLTPNDSAPLVINLPIYSSFGGAYIFGSMSASYYSYTTTFFNLTSYVNILGHDNNNVTINAPMATGELPSGAFCGFTGLTSLNIDYGNITKINEKAFFGCYRLFNEITLSLPKLTSIGLGAFGGTTKLLSVYMPSLSIINVGSSGIFAPIKLSTYNTIQAGITTLSLPNLLSITGCLATQCPSLLSVYFPKLKTISTYAFYNCNALQTVSFPLLEQIYGSNAFYYCHDLSYIYFPSLSIISGRNVFMSCSSLLEISFPMLSIISGVGVFSSCGSLTSVILNSIGMLSGASMFYRCYHLISLFLLGSSVCTLGNTITSMFISTPVSNYSASAGRYASIFVPQSLLASYKAATNWTTISSKIFAYESYFDANGNPL